MSITDDERNQLFVWFEEHMGKERATTMMSLLPPVGWGDVATKRDLDAHAAATTRDLEALDIKIGVIADRLEARFDTVATKVELHELHLAMQKTFVTWMFASQAAVIAAIGVFLALFR